MNLERRNVQTWIRTPIVPGMTDDEENIKAIASMIAPVTMCYKMGIIAVP